MSVNAPEPVPSLPALRLLPVPSCEPPFDDELSRHPAGVAALRPAGRLRPLVPLRLVPVADPDTDPDDDGPDTLSAPDEPAVTDAAAPAVDLPPARAAARALVQGLLEVMAGVRPVSQLRRATSAELFEALEFRVHAAPRPHGARPRSGAVRSLHVQERATVAEVCARVDRDGRSAAIALRLDGADGQWRCTELSGL